MSSSTGGMGGIPALVRKTAKASEFGKSGIPTGLSESKTSQGGVSLSVIKQKVK